MGTLRRMQNAGADASMGPRSDERGNVGLSLPLFNGRLASMGPRSDERGNEAKSRVRDNPYLSFNGAALG